MSLPKVLDDDGDEQENVKRVLLVSLIHFNQEKKLVSQLDKFYFTLKKYIHSDFLIWRPV